MPTTNVPLPPREWTEIGAAGEGFLLDLTADGEAVYSVAEPAETFRGHFVPKAYSIVIRVPVGEKAWARTLTAAVAVKTLE